MFEFLPLASGSTGNLYKVKYNNDFIIIDCGLIYSEVQRLLDYQTTAAAGCLLTHCHGDHSKSIKKIMSAGVNSYMTSGTAAALSLSGHRLKIIKAGNQFEVGPFKIYPFATIHNAADPVGFFIAAGRNRLLFATDTMYLSPRFSGLTHIAIEANYSSGVMSANVSSGVYPEVAGRSVMRNHMEFETTKKTIMANDLSKVKKIFLLHISKTNGEPEKWKSEIEGLTGKPVYV